jgi:hypothetical protein
MFESILFLAALVAAPALLAYASVRWGVDSRPGSADRRRPLAGLSVR